MAAPESANGKIVDGVLTHAVNILRVAASERKSVLAALEELEGELLGKLQGANLSPGKAARAQALLQQTQTQIADAYKVIAANNGKSLAKIATLEATKTVNVVNNALQVPLATVAQTPEQLAAIGSKVMVNGRFPAEWWKDQGDQLANRFSAQVRLGMLNGEGIDQIVARIRGTKAKQYADGIMAVSKAQATALVRTGVQSAANQARIETALKNQDVVKGIQWVSTLDARTTPICRALDGLQWSLPDFKPVGHDKKFPGAIAHWQCRSTQVPVTRSWADLAGPGSKLKTEIVDLQKAMEEKLIAEGMSAAEAAKVLVNTRASMDGQVAGSMKFDDWLKTKSTDFQNKLLGTGKAALWRDGKLTLSEMTDVDNNPLTLAQLHELVSTNADVPPVQEGEEGLSLAERKLLQSSMVAGVESDAVLVHYVNGDTGEHFTLDATTATEAEAAKIKAVPNLTVIQNSKVKGTVWTEQQFRFFGSLPNFRKALMVGPNGRVLSVAVKAGKVFDDAAAKDIMAKFADMKAVKTIPHTQHKFQSAVAKNGTLKFGLTPEGTINVPPKTYNKVFVAGEKPLPFFDADAAKASQEAAQAAAKAAADAAAKAAAEKATADAIEAQADLAMAARAAEVAASSEATAARAAAYKAGKAADAAQKAADEAAAALKKANDAAQAEIADILANPKGKTLQAKALAGVMKSDPGLAPAQMLAKAKEDAALAQKKASQAAALSGYKQKVLGGLAPTPAQLKAYQALSTAEQTAFDNSIAAAKLAKDTADAEALAAQLQMEAAATQAVADSKPAVPLPPVSSKPLPKIEGFPDDPENLTVVKALGGSTGAELVKDKQGNLWVRKRGNSAAHLREEAIADQLYRALGVATPDSRLYDRPGGPVKLSRFQEGQPLNEWWRTATPAARKAMLAEIQKGFAADALIANWDVLGLNLDNILVDATGKPWRIDNGGALRFRAQGQPKGKDWNDHTAELWTMRARYTTPELQALAKAIPPNVQKHFADHFGDLTIYDVARQIEAMDGAALAFAPDDLRATLERRLANLKALSTRALDFEHAQWSADFTDNMTRASMELRERGVVGRMVPKFTVNAGSTIMKDANGVEWDELRSKKAAGTVAVDPVDPYAQKFLNAIISINHNAKTGSGKFSNPDKLALVKAEAAKLAKAMAAGDQQAGFYYGWLKNIEEAEKKFAKGTLGTGADVLPKFDASAGAKLAPNVSAAQKAPPRPAGSITQDVAAYIAERGGDARAVSAWMSSQAQHSWGAQSQAMKYFIATEKTIDPGATFFWGTDGITGAKKQFDLLASQYGGEAALRQAFTSWISYTQEILTNTAMPNVDQTRRVVRLIRTEYAPVMTMNGIKVGQYGGVHTFKKGANESHSIMKITSVHGSEVTVQAVPFADITGLYVTDKPGGGGSGGSGFYGDGENEFTANSNGTPFIYAGNSSSLPGVWKNALAAGHDAGSDATKWGVPLTHIRQ